MASRRTNGEGCFVELPDGRYRLRAQFGNNLNGHPRIITVTGKNKTECISKMKKRKAELQNVVRNSNVSVATMTLTQLCTLHLKEHLKEADRLKMKSADRRECTIKNQIAPYPIGSYQVGTIRPHEIEAHIESLLKTKLSISSIKKTLDVINAAYNWAMNQSYITYNPCTPVKDKLTNRFKNIAAKKSNDSDVIVLSDDEIKILKSKTEDYSRDYGMAAALFLLDTGMRIGELCALKWRDYHRQTQTIAIDTTRFVAKSRTQNGTKEKYIAAENIVKNAHAREIVLSSNAIKILNKLYDNTSLKEDDDYIFLNSHLQPTNPSALSKHINALYRDAGLDEGISGAHVLRRTFATLKHQEGVSAKDIAAYMGDLESTINKYYIAVRKKIKSGNRTINVVPYPLNRTK